ncbi:MAG TPA: serine/threonine-protein kinase [Kofleriaceae bacterium]|nr:serine/threonine-protein kinase [Kofleriaceae bacterium]
MTEPDEIPPGTRIGRYRVVSTLGRGGMGGVMEVEDDTGARYALKAPVQDIEGIDVTRRFAREANVLRMLDHPNLVSAVDVFTEGGRLYLVMEKVTGEPLSRALDFGELHPRRALVLTRQALAGIGHAHAQGLIHRDLKPDNILLVDMGGWERVKIIDFGIVKLTSDVAAAFGAEALTSTGIVFGTPRYMAPEQALGQLLDTRADLYALGIILYEMLAGRPPFEFDDPVAMLKAHAKSPPPPLAAVTGNAPWCTRELVALVEGALAKKPDQRFASAEVMTAVLDEAFRSLEGVCP